ncbi:guanine nucleotide binding protein, alpha subunit [Desarmillaria tabescens]|uniref:Guanine nucleotide binding protein, alpha subunit n=1 Tax=Armillaria tabescens TaxID=1929756 RepID=A0AA39JT33_ARMTA|nr:guanine nucleotide binding protein, alpha subunit [Desarmillaria tabescens]KAK0446068.1 guanine nucleotide binding protein, alpha subunit [Desarmillaria tabescens]
MPSIATIGRTSTDGGGPWPPPNPPDANEEERLARLEREREAQKVSDAIDRAISVEKEQRKKQNGVKLLLLGQAESGKSTILKNFQLRFAPKTFQAEAELWRPIIHLNLVRSVNFILDLLSSERPTSSSPSMSPSSEPDNLRRIQFSLRPLKQVEDSLMHRISGSLFLPVVSGDELKEFPRYHPAKASEVSVRSGSGWMGFMKLRKPADSSSGRSAQEKMEDEQNRRILEACVDDIQTLWRAREVQNRLAKRDISLVHQPGFFLEDVERISKQSYVPTSQDILRARVKTIGPEEHRIPMDTGVFPPGPEGKHWIIYDVGGSRSQRAKWAQFFDDVTAIIFLAPISAFNQVLAEDATVNRLADSFKLWKMICSNKLLAPVDLILFLNKMDILEANLDSGVQFSKYVPNYKDRPNEAKHVSKYLLDVFTAMHNQSTPKKRKVHAHLTCAIDTESTSLVITQVQEVILVKTLAQTNIL